MSPSLVRSRSLFVVSFFLFILPFLPPFPLSLEKKKKRTLCSFLRFSLPVLFLFNIHFHPFFLLPFPQFLFTHFLFPLHFVLFFPHFLPFLLFLSAPPPLVFFHIKRREELKKDRRKAVNTRKNLQHIYYLIYLTRKDHADVDPITTTNTDN